MKSRNLSIFGVLAWLAVSIAGCSRQAQEAPKEKSEEKPEESRVKRGTNGEVTITIDLETQKLMGLQTAELVATRLNAEIKTYGHVLDSTPLGDLLNQLQTAEVALENSHQELERMKMLLAQQNASEKAFRAAEAAYLHDRLAVKSVLLKVQATWGKQLSNLMASYTPSNLNSNGQSPIPARLASLESVVVRVDLPPSEVLDAPSGASLVLADPKAKPVIAQFLDLAPSADMQMQARGIFFIADNAGRQFAPGLAVTALVDTGQEPREGVVVPQAAVVRAKGTVWVYVQTGTDLFTRKEINTERPEETGWFVRDGVKPHDKVVIVGAQQLLSEELKGQSGD